MCFLCYNHELYCAKSDGVGFAVNMDEIISAELKACYYPDKKFDF